MSKSTITIEEITPRKEIDEDQLKKICLAVSNFMHDNYDSYTTAIISGNEIKIVQDQKYIPVIR